MAKALSRKVTIYINGREVENTLSSLRAEMKKLESQQAKLPIGSEEYIQASLKIREIKSVIREQEVAVRGLGNEWKSTTTKVAEFANVVTGLNSAFQMVDIGIGKLKDLAKTAAELDDVYADVMKTTGLTHEQVEKLNEAFKKMDTRTSREQLNQLAYEAGKLGINSAEAVAQFVSASDKINIALGDVLGEGAMVTVGKLTNIYEGVSKTLEGKNLEEKMLAIGSAVNSLGQASTANEGYMVEFMKRLGGIAAQAGMSADQVLGYASALDQNGQAVEMSATAFMKLIQQMVKKPEEFVQAAGVSIEEFRRMMDEDMNGAVLRTLEGMEKGGGFQQLIGMFADMGLDGARAATVVSSLAKHLDQVREAQELANREMQTGSSVINEFNTKNETMQAQAEKAKKRFEEVRIELGNELYPVLIHLQKSGTVLMKGVAGFVQLIKENKAILPGLIALMANWVRMKTLAFVASGKLQGSIKSLLGIEKLQAHQQDVQTAKTLKKVAAEEQEKLKSIQMQLAIEKENLARQQNSSLIEVQRLAAITRNKVYNLEIAATNQATVATNANAAAVKAQKAAFSSTPWGLIITALTSIAALTIKIVHNSNRWKISQTLKEVARETYAAQQQLDYLFDKLKNATEGSEQYKGALEELKNMYPELIQKYIDEKGRLKDLEKAYKDVAKAAKESIYERVKREKLSEAASELGEDVFDAIERIRKHVYYQAERKGKESIASFVFGDIEKEMKKLEAGEIDATEALRRYYKIMDDNKLSDWSVVQGGKSARVYDYMDRSINKIAHAAEKYRELEDAYDKMLGENNTDPWGLQKKSLEELEAMLKEVNEAKKTAGSVLELRELIAKSEAITKQIEKLKPKTETITTTGTGETEAERKAREKREKAQAKAEAAWTRFSNSYEQAMSKINAKTLSGIEAIGAEIDATTQKMRTDLEAVDKNLHPEAAQMLTDLEAKAEEWKRAKIDEYIAKTNKELDKLAKSAAKTGDGKQIDKVRKATAELEEKLHSIDEAILQLTFDQATLFSKTDEASVRQLHDINEQIAAYKRLRQAMVASVFAEIAPETKRPFKKQEDNRVSLSYQENYTRALTATQAEVEKYTKVLEDALAAEQEMARVARENGNLEEAEKHEKNAEAIQHETENLEELNEEAKKLAKEDAMSKTLNKWAEVMEDFGSKALSIFSNINTMLKNQAQQRLNELEDEKDDQIKVLDEQFEQGLISEEQYNTRKQELEDNYKAQALEAEKEDWRRQKAYGYSEAIINAAVAATKLWAGEGTTAYKIGMSALLAAEMATQIAAIESQPEPRARGGYINNNQLYRVGERGREWIASNSLLNDPATAPVIEALEAYQRGNRRALADVPMAQLNMPVATAAARELGRRTVGAMENTLLSMPTATQKFDVNMPDSGEMMKLWQELATYLKDPKNRQAVISRRTMTDFETNENFLRNIARI